MRLAQRQRSFMASLAASREPRQPALAIYHAAVRANRRQALASTYPVVQRLVGDAFFAAMAEAFCERFPSRSGDLARLGRGLAGFVASYPPAAALSYLGDVARLEWALHESARAAQAPAFDFGELRKIPAERHGELRLALNPSVRLLESPHPVLAIWEANQPGRDGAPETNEGPDRVLVCRAGLEPLARRLPEHDFTMLAALERRASLAEVCDALGGAAVRLETLLRDHAAGGVICGFEPPR